MMQGRSMRGVRPVILVALVAFALWRPLVAGGTLAPDDQLWLSDPFNAEPPAGLTIELAEADASAIHGAWVAWAEDVRSGQFSWWRDAGAGQPALADGLPFTHLAYLVVPGWYASGVVAALALLVAAFGAMRLADRQGMAPLGGLLAGVVFGFSGLMFTWLGWPHATAIAIAPWVIGSILGLADRPSAPKAGRAGLLIAAQLWCGVFAISVFTVLGGVAWWSIEARRRRSAAGSGAVAAAIALGAAVAAPHLWLRWERWSWADTSHLEIGDTSASVLGLITTVVGSALGNESVGIAWVETGSFQLTVGFVGVAAVVAAAGASFAGGRAIGPAIIGLIGMAVGYVGGPFSSLAALVIGETSLASHARVLLVLSLAMLAALGVDALSRAAITPARCAAAARSLRARLALGLAMALIVGLGFAWFDALRTASTLQPVAAHLVGTAAVVAVVTAVGRSWWRRRLSTEAVKYALVALAAYELLSFGMPIPTVTERDERVTVTDAHVALLEIVEDGGRIAGDHDVFSPASSARFGIADVRAPGLRSTEEIDAFIAVDPSSVRGAVGGSPFEPVIRVRDDADPSGNPMWDLLGVDAWVLPRDATPPGLRSDPQPDLRSSAPLISPIGSLVVPEGGLRAVVVDLVTPAFTTVSIEVNVGQQRVETEAVLRTPRDGPTAIAIAGEGLPPASEARVILTLDTGEQAAEIGTTGGVMALGTIAGTPDSTLIWTDGAIILARPSPRAVWDGPGEATVEIVLDEPDRIIAEVLVTERGVLRSDIVNEPGWRVRHDGNPTPERLVGDLVLGVDLEPGSHRIEFSYRPPRLAAGLIVALAGLLLWGAWAIVERRGAAQTRW